MVAVVELSVDVVRIVSVVMASAWVDCRKGVEATLPSGDEARGGGAPQMHPPIIARMPKVNKSHNVKPVAKNILGGFFNLSLSPVYSLMQATDAAACQRRRAAPCRGFRPFAARLQSSNWSGRAIRRPVDQERCTASVNSM